MLVNILKLPGLTVLDFKETDDEYHVKAPPLEISRTDFWNWKPYILNYFDDQRVTNAFTESFNAKVREVYRNGRGYTFERLRAKVLYTDMFQKRIKVQEKVRARKQKFEDVTSAGYMCLTSSMQDEYETRIQTRVINLGTDLPHWSMLLILASSSPDQG